MAESDQATFDQAANAAREYGRNGGQMSNEDALILYSLFKQATVGDVNTDRPGIFSPTDRAKWDAWNGQKGKAQDQARGEYVQNVRRLIPNAGV